MLLPFPPWVLPSWAAPHQAILEALDLAGLGVEDQRTFLVERGLTPQQALRMALTLPPASPWGQRERVHRAARMVNLDPEAFWQVIEILRDWSLHPWSILGEPLCQRHSPAWEKSLAWQKQAAPLASTAPGRGQGLYFWYMGGRGRELPDGLCTGRLMIADSPMLVRLPEGIVVEELHIQNCPNLQGSLERVTVLGGHHVEGCPQFRS